jgi:flagellar protein FliL
MAHKSESKSGGFMQLAISIVAVSAIGLGAGFGFSFVLLSPDAGSAVARDQLSAAHETTQAPEKIKTEEGKSPSHSPSTAEAPADPTVQEDEYLASSDVVLAPFPPVTTNLAEPSTVWVRLEGNLVIKKSAEAKSADLAQSVAPRIMAYLRTAKLSDIQGASGLSALSSDLNEVVRSSSDGEIRAVLLSGFIVE